MYVGIDLGTTNSVVSRAFRDVNNNIVNEVVRIGQLDENDNWDAQQELPSMVYFAADGSIAVGKKAKFYRDIDRNNVVTNAKRFMGTHHQWKVRGNTYEARDIGAMVLQHCKREIDRRKMKYDAVVITVPASFTPNQSQDTVAAAIQAGFQKDRIFIKHEPTAALLSYIDEQSRYRAEEREVNFSKKQRVLVFDIGGGTCDTSIIDVLIDARNRVHFTEVGIGRYTELGGIDFDARLADKLLEELFEDEQLSEGDLTQEQKDKMFRRLMLASEMIKERISSAIKSKLLFDPDCDIETVTEKYNLINFYDGKPYNLVMDKKHYDEYTNELYIDRVAGSSRKFSVAVQDKNIIGIIRETLEKYKIDKDSIDYVFMTGGMSKFPTVREKVAEYVGRPIIEPEDPMNAVAKGAAVYMFYNPNDRLIKTSDGEQSIMVEDKMILAESVMLNVSEGLPRVIIPKGTPVPYEGELRGAFFTAAPMGVNINIYSGSDEFDSSMRIQQTFQQRFKSPVELGTPFDIRYTIDENKVIRMSIVIDDGVHHVQEIVMSIFGDKPIAEQHYNLMEKS